MKLRKFEFLAFFDVFRRFQFFLLKKSNFFPNSNVFFRSRYPCITAVPPPNIIQHQPPPMQPQQQNIIFQTTSNSTGPIPLQQLQFHPPPNMIETQSNLLPPNGHDIENHAHDKDDKSSPEPNDMIKTEDKSDSDNHDTGDPNAQPNGHNISMQVPPPLRYASASLMAMPPPISCVQHIVGNTLITSSQPAGTQTHQIYNPVSLQQIQTAPPTQQHQIHVSSSGQHFLVNTQYQQQLPIQQVPQNVQSFQLTQPRYVNSCAWSGGFFAVLRNANWNSLKFVHFALQIGSKWNRHG